MAYIAFASAKGSPGVTTTIAALAATWPVERSLLVVEADPAGGDLAVRLDLSPEPGLVSLAAAGRRDLDEATLLAHTQALPGPAQGSSQGRHHAQVVARRVLPAPVAADQAAAALIALRERLARVLSASGADVLVDCGRLDHGSPATRLATEADLLVVVARPVVAEVHHLASRLASLEPRAVSLLLVGERPYSVEEVAEAVGAVALGTLPDDRRAATAWSVGHPDGLRVVRRSRLLRSAYSLSDGLATWLSHGAGAGAGQRPPAAVPYPPPPAAVAGPEGVRGNGEQQAAATAGRPSPARGAPPDVPVPPPPPGYWPPDGPPTWAEEGPSRPAPSPPNADPGQPPVRRSRPARSPRGANLAEDPPGATRRPDLPPSPWPQTPPSGTPSAAASTGSAVGFDLSGWPPGESTDVPAGIGSNTGPTVPTRPAPVPPTGVPPLGPPAGYDPAGGLPPGATPPAGIPGRRGGSRSSWPRNGRPLPVPPPPPPLSGGSSGDDWRSQPRHADEPDPPSRARSNGRADGRSGDPEEQRR